MRIKIHRPKLLAAVLLVILGLGSAAVIWADELAPWRNETPVFPAIPVSQQVTPKENEQAVAIVKDSGIVEIISGSQEWTATQGTEKKIGGNTVVKLYASWEKPAMSSGPWVDAECRGTRMTVVSTKVSNITKLALWVDIEAKEVVAYVPGAPEPGETGPIEAPLENDLKVLVYDAKSGELIYDGTHGDLGKLCPEGTEDG